MQDTQCGERLHVIGNWLVAKKNTARHSGVIKLAKIKEYYSFFTSIIYIYTYEVAPLSLSLLTVKFKLKFFYNGIIRPCGNRNTLNNIVEKGFLDIEISIQLPQLFVSV